MASQREMLEYQHPALHDPRVMTAYGHSPYAPQIYAAPCYGSDQAQDFQYLNHQHPNVAYFDEKRDRASMPQSRRPSAVRSFNGSGPELAQPVSLKRKVSEDVNQYDLAPPQKKVSSAHLQGQPNGVYDSSGQTSPYSQYAVTPISNGSFQHAGLAAPTARIGHQYSISNASQISLAAPSPHTPGWSPDFATIKTEPSPQAPMTPVARPASSSPIKSSVPRLVRTSTIQQPSPVTSNFNQTYTSSFNPYVMYPLKACLQLKGDLMSMTKNWSEQEVNDRRRLVEFKRSQDGSNINADFHPVVPEERTASSITISCILWKEKKDYYVTSVDTIYLLEALVGVRFTVEEKNRIRRNLEGYRPATVSKSKADSEEFFKVIMGFPHPKPRNIEKDVKVFPWKILAEALKKIISKYSASYSSTAAVNVTPLASNYGADMSEMGYPPSPPPSHSYLAQYAYEQSTYPPGMIPGRMSAPVTTAPVPHLQVQLPTSGPAYEMGDSFNFTMPGMPQASMLLGAEALSAPIRAPSWDYNQFVNDSPVTSAPQTAPPGAWTRPQFETADFNVPSNY